ncbi:MAG: triple tyrosine motif-containing protein, partial [Salinivirgaceae bacterium]
KIRENILDNKDLSMQQFSRLFAEDYKKWKKNNKLKVIDAPGVFHFSFRVGRELYVTDNEKGIYRLHADELKFVAGSQFFAGKEITSILPLNNRLLVSTLDDGVFAFSHGVAKKWQNPWFTRLKQSQIYTSIKITDTQIAFGTVQNGLYVISAGGELILHMDETKGLQNNTILSLFVDRFNHLWLGTDNGIDMLKMNSPFRLINRHNGISAGYTAVEHNGLLYLGTNRGVFYRRHGSAQGSGADQNIFKLIKATKGQVWALEVIDNQLFCGHNSGAYLIDGTTAEKISDIHGVWNFVSSEKQPDKIISGTYTGLILFEKNDGRWRFAKQFSGFDESSRMMHWGADGNLWMSHVYKGVYKIQLNSTIDTIENVSYYNSDHGFEVDYGVNATKIGGNVVFLAPSGVYAYNAASDSMQKTAQYNELFDCSNVRYAKEMSNGDVWSVCNKQIQVARYLEDGSYSKISIPFHSLEGKLIDNFEFVYALSDQLVLIGYENGFVIYDKSYKKNYNEAFQVFLREVRLSSNDSVLVQGKIFDQQEPFHLEHKNNGLHFFFSAVDFNNAGKLEFSTHLNGYGRTWSDWESLNHREFTNIPAGDYTFYLKARNIYGIETEPFIFQFSVAPPFYKTVWAYVSYVVFVVLIIVLTVFYVLRRIKNVKIREKERQKEKYKERERALQQEALVAEKEIVKLRNEKLRQEMKNKDRELANGTMQTIKKNDFLISLKNDLAKIAKLTPSNEVRTNVRKTIRKIDHDISNEQNWTVFEKHFLDVHEEFIGDIKEQYPDISPSELRLCACLRMNLSTKEIATLFNLSVRGVETSRYRLRKTLNLDRDTNLTDFILSF